MVPRRGIEPPRLAAHGPEPKLPFALFFKYLFSFLAQVSSGYSACQPHGFTPI